MRTFGLTGGVGMGKSTAASLLARRGLPVIDTDEIARQVVEVGQPALEEIRAAFGQSVIAPDGTLRREALACAVFAQADARLRLEAILHPRIHALWQQQITTWRAAGAAAAVVVIPLLFETETQGLFDVTVCVACSEATQHRRLLARGWTEEDLRQRIQAQLPIGRKMELADYVVWNEGALAVLEAQFDRILSRELERC
jgi:dephospho-CoA kinase